MAKKLKAEPEVNAKNNSSDESGMIVDMMLRKELYSKNNLIQKQ